MGGLVNFKDCSQEQSKQLVKCLNSGLISGGTRDVIWLTVHGRLPVRKVVKWARTITITECPVPQCKETETIGHLLIDCVRSKEVWDKMSSIGVRVPCHRKTLYADFICDKENYDLFWTCVCVTVYKIWKTRCKMTINNIYVDSENVFKQIKAELRKRRTKDLKRIPPKLNWSAIIL